MSPSQARIPLKFYLTFGTPACIAFALGVWQTKRYFWKKNLIDSRLQHLNSESPGKFDASTLENLQERIPKYEPLLFEGEFLNAYTQFLGPRKSPYARRNNLQMTENGYYVLTPLKTEHGIVLINRGWIEDKDKVDRPEGRVTVTAVLREAEYPSYIHPDKFHYKGVWFINDPAKIYEALGFNNDIPVEAELVTCSYKTNLQTRQPEDFVVFTTMPATHFSYLLTWYSLSAWCMIGAYAYRKRLLNIARRSRQTDINSYQTMTFRNQDSTADFTQKASSIENRSSNAILEGIVSSPNKQNNQERKSQLKSIFEELQSPASSSTSAQEFTETNAMGPKSPSNHTNSIDSQISDASKTPEEDTSSTSITNLDQDTLQSKRYAKSFLSQYGYKSFQKNIDKKDQM